MITYFSNQPDPIEMLTRPDGSSDVSLRKDIQETEDGWMATEVKFTSRLSRDEIMNQFNTYFMEDPEPTLSDVVDAMNILMELIMED